MKEEKRTQWIIYHSDSFYPVAARIDLKKENTSLFSALEEAFIIFPNKGISLTDYFDDLVGCRLSIGQCFYDPGLNYNVEKCVCISHASNKKWDKFLEDYKIGMERQQNIKKVKDEKCEN